MIGGGILPVGFLCALFGVVAAAKFHGLNPALALPTIAAELTSLVGGIFLAALWAADISTAVGLLMGCSTMVLEDIVKKAYKKPIADRNQIAVSRATVLGVSVLSFLLALTVSSILSMLTTALAITTSFTLLILANIYASRLLQTRRGLLRRARLARSVARLDASARAGIRKPVAGNAEHTFFFKGQLIYPEWLVCLLIFAAFVVFGKKPADKLLPHEDS